MTGEEIKQGVGDVEDDHVDYKPVLIPAYCQDMSLNIEIGLNLVQKSVFWRSDIPLKLSVKHHFTANKATSSGLNSDTFRLLLAA